MMITFLSPCDKPELSDHTNAHWSTFKSEGHVVEVGTLILQHFYLEVAFSSRKRRFFPCFHIVVVILIWKSGRSVFITQLCEL